MQLSIKLAVLELDDIEPPSDDASPLEHRIYEVVERMKEWKPYIPATVFMNHDTEDKDGTEICEEPSKAETFSEIHTVRTSEDGAVSDLESLEARGSFINSHCYFEVRSPIKLPVFINQLLKTVVPLIPLVAA